MRSPRLGDAIEWSQFRVGADAATGHLGVKVGVVGSGSPTALITAGIHGDEGPWGAWAIRMLLDRVPLSELTGTLKVVPVTNPLAMAADARCAPLDALDLNRSFPGDPLGSHTERLAAGLIEHALAHCDVVIDLHGGGSWCVNAFAFAFDGSEALAEAVGAPLLVRRATDGRPRGGTLTEYAQARGASVTAVEMGGRGPAERAWAERIADGVYRALAVGGVVSPMRPQRSPQPATRVGATRVLRPGRGGVFIPVASHEAVGTIVPRGTVLGHVLDSSTMEVVETFEAPFEQTALLLLRPFVARVEAGAMTYVVSEPV